MAKASRCSVCDSELDSTIPLFCSTCNWETGEDIRLHSFLTKPTDEEIERYNTKLERAKNLWEEMQRLKDMEKEFSNINEQYNNLKEDFQELKKNRREMGVNIELSSKEIGRKRCETVFGLHPTFRSLLFTDVDI